MRQNKLYILIFLALFSGLGLQAQKKFRPSLNLSGSDQELWNFGVMFGNYPETDQDWLEGFNVRLIAERNLIERLDLRIEPGIIFEKLIPDPNTSDTSWEPFESSSTEIQIPLVIKYSSNRVSNINPFVLAGYQPAYQFENKELIHYIEAGFGLDFYLRKSKAALHMRLNKNLSNAASSGIFIGFSVETRDGWKLYRQ
jgi:hypothetical protein